MPQPTNARSTISGRLKHAFHRQILERPAPRLQRCQCGYWVAQVPCAVCRATVLTAPALAPPAASQARAAVG
jgi:hypothetical protein